MCWENLILKNQFNPFVLLIEHTPNPRWIQHGPWYSCSSSPKLSCVCLKRRCAVSHALYGQSVFVFLLVMPMGTNVIRGAVVKSLSKIWNTNSGIRYISYIVVFMNVVYFVRTYINVYHSERTQPQGRWEECDSKIQLFREQRNLYITAGSIFLFFIFRRVLDIQTKLFEARKEVKANKKKWDGFAVRSWSAIDPNRMPLDHRVNGVQ